MAVVVVVYVIEMHPPTSMEKRETQKEIARIAYEKQGPVMNMAARRMINTLQESQWIVGAASYSLNYLKMKWSLVVQNNILEVKSLFVDMI